MSPLRSQLPPPPEAYGRVTDAERFRPLHRIALDLIAALRSEYDVEETREFDPFPTIGSVEHTLPPVTLRPRGHGAPLGVAFTPFPSLAVRFGRWHWDQFPSCGCDACAEDPEEEGDRFRTLVRQVVEGEIAEELVVPLIRSAELRLWRGDFAHSARRGPEAWQRFGRSWAREYRKMGEPGRVQWEPWPRRPAVD